jgi:uroporphyrinogen-III synthase
MLSGLNVVITRPRSQSLRISEQIHALGGVPVVFPTLEIADLEDKTSLREVMQRLNSFHIAIFLSINAVKKVIPFWLAPAGTPKLKIAAVGSGTANALRSHGIPVDYLPQTNYSSENLLELTALQQVSQQEIVIFSGEGGRNLLEKSLHERGAIVTKVPTYRRIQPEANLNILASVTKNAAKNIVLSTSCESLDNLLNILQGTSLQMWLYRTPLLVISQRMQAYALERGFSQNLLLQTDQPSEAAILAKLITWYTNRAQW